VVVALDAARRRVVVGSPSGGSVLVRLREVNWLSTPEERRCRVKLRAREEPHGALLRPLPGGAAEVVLDAPARAAPGQACVFYDGDRVLGGGFICTPTSATAA
jgi:tRNA-specific 2-thiouridylase